MEATISPQSCAISNQPRDLVKDHNLKILTRHLKQSKWNMPPRARTNWPVKSSPHFWHIFSCPLAVLPLRGRDRLRSPGDLRPSKSLSRSLPPLALPVGEPVILPSLVNGKFGLGNSWSCIPPPSYLAAASLSSYLLLSSAC